MQILLCTFKLGRLCLLEAGQGTGIFGESGDDACYMLTFFTMVVPTFVASVDEKESKAIFNTTIERWVNMSKWLLDVVQFYLGCSYIVMLLVFFTFSKASFVFLIVAISFLSWDVYCSRMS